MVAPLGHNGDDRFDVRFKGKIFSSTICTTSCTILTHGSKYLSCTRYRSDLRSLHSRWSRKRKTPSKNENNRYLRTSQKENKLRMLQARAQAAETEVKRLKSRIEESTMQHGIQVDPELHQDLSSIMESNNESVVNEFPQGSFRCLFRDEQLKFNRLKDARQMRWHPMMIRWCLNLSSSSYHALRTSGFIRLPSERTLRDYTHFFKSKAGFQVEVEEMLVRDMKLSELPDWKLYDKHGAYCCWICRSWHGK